MIPVGGVMALEVFNKHFIDSFSIGRIAASVAHRAASAVQVLPHDHRYFPDTLNFKLYRNLNAWHMYEITYQDKTW